MREHALGLLFTDMSGQVIFADPHFLRLMNYPEAAAITGEPLHKALGLEQKIAKQFLEDLHHTGNVQNRVLDISAPTGKTIRLACSGVATYDPSGIFIGADITLRHTNGDSKVEDVQIKDHAGIIETKIQQTLETAATTTGNINAVNEDVILMAVYFRTHIEALYVLFTRLMGMKAPKQLDNLVNKAAQKSGWKNSIKDGHFYSDITGTDPKIYGTVLGEMVNYGVNLIGKKVVAREVNLIDSHMDAKVLELAEQAGMRQTIGALLK